MGAKIYNALFMVLAIEVGMFLFPKPGYSSTSLYDFLLNPVSLTNAIFPSWLIGMIVTLGALGAIVVGSFAIKQDWIWRGALAFPIASFVYVLFQLGDYIFSFGFLGNARYVLTLLVIAPLTLYFFVTIIDFISGKD